MSEKKPLRIASLRFHASLALTGEPLAARVGSEIAEARPAQLDENGIAQPPKERIDGFRLVRRFRDAEEVVFVPMANVVNVLYTREPLPEAPKK